jgi:hypothetical protein
MLQFMDRGQYAEEAALRNGKARFSMGIGVNICHCGSNTAGPADSKVIKGIGGKL